MKHQHFILGLLILAIAVSGCTRTKPAENDKEAESAELTEVDFTEEESNMLIVYFSLSGNTKFAAQQIQAYTGADIFELQAAEPYSENYTETLERARGEKDAGFRPPLARSSVSV